MRLVVSIAAVRTLEKATVMAGLSLSNDTQVPPTHLVCHAGIKETGRKSAVGIGHARKDRGSAKDSEPLNRGGAGLFRIPSATYLFSLVLAACLPPLV